MDTDTDDCAERRTAGQTMTVEVRNDVPEELDAVTSDMVALGERIGAVGLIVSAGDSDGFERFCTGDEWSDALVEAFRSQPTP